MSTTPILGIEELAASQAQPELTVNEAIRILECIASRTAIDKDLTAPPGSPSDGDVYLIGSNPSGDWANKDFQIALYAGSDWLYIQPRAGWLFYLDDEGLYYQYAAGSPSAWIAYP
jgi:hypothetical protein